MPDYKLLYIERRRFSGRGLARARTELALEGLVHHLLVRHRFSYQKQNVQKPNPKPKSTAA